MAINVLNEGIMKLLFNNEALPDIGNAAGLQPSSAAGSYFIGLHTADPGPTGMQNVSEATYTGYQRVAVARSAAGFVVSGNNATNAAVIEFPESTGGSNTITHVSIGLGSTGETKILRKFALDVALAVSTGVQPIFKAGELDVDITDVLSVS